MGGTELKHAKRLLQRKKYSEIIRMLEPQVFRFRQDPDFYYLLGTAYFHTGDIAGATTYLRRVIDLQKEHVPSMLQLAAIELQKRNNASAIEWWLQVLESDAGNTYAKRGLELLKKGSHNRKIIDNFISADKIGTLVPKRKNYRPFITAAVVIVVLVVPVILNFLTEITLLPDAVETRNVEVSQISIEKDDEIVSLEGEYVYVLTEKEIMKLMDEAKEQFNRFNDNTVQQIVNKLKYSNASETVRQKAAMLEKYLRRPDFTNFTGDIPYEEVMKEPLLYENCYVRWKGKVSNLEITPSEIHFDFLVGYHDNKILKGIIPVHFNFAVSLDQGSPVEIIGKIEDPAGRPRILGSSIRPIAPDTARNR
jgi:tetratricopeptide (TPR) repeat protein